MSRVTPAEVKSIVDTNLDNATLQTWIDGASVIVTASEACIGDNGVLKQVELYLSAHLVAMLDPSLRGFVVKEGPAGFQTTYANPVVVRDSIDGTPFGTMANSLSNGCLAGSTDRAVSLCSLGGY